MTPPAYRFLSLGAGIQSSTLVVLAAHGRIPTFDAAIFADTGWEQPLRRHGFIRAVVASNAVGAPVDTILFLALAGFPIWAAVPGQLLAKATATAVPVACLLGARALLRHCLRPEGT